MISHRRTTAHLIRRPQKALISSKISEKSKRRRFPLLVIGQIKQQLHCTLSDSCCNVEEHIMMMCYNTNEFCVREPAYKFFSTLYTLLHGICLFCGICERRTTYSYRKETIWDLREFVFFFYTLTKHERHYLALFVVE